MTRKTTKLRYQYKDFYECYPKKDKLSIHQFRLIQKTFFHLLRKAMLYEGRVFKLPEGIGTIGVFWTGREKRYYNFQHYKETGEKIYIRNTHSDRKQFGIKYVAGDKFQSEIPLSFLFKFKANRGFARELAQALKVKNTSSLYIPYEIYVD